MKYYTTPVWLDCAASGCGAGLAVDSRHLDNINASGGWHCPNHEGGATRVPDPHTARGDPGRPTGARHPTDHRKEAGMTVQPKTAEEEMREFASALFAKDRSRGIFTKPKPATEEN